MPFNKLLKDVRKELKMTQEQFVHEIGVSFSTLSPWENSHTSPILMARKSIINICKEKGVSSELISKLENAQSLWQKGGAVKCKILKQMIYQY